MRSIVKIALVDAENPDQRIVLKKFVDGELKSEHLLSVGKEKNLDLSPNEELTATDESSTGGASVSVTTGSAAEAVKAEDAPNPHEEPPANSQPAQTNQAPEPTPEPAPAPAPEPEQPAAATEANEAAAQTEEQPAA